MLSLGLTSATKWSTTRVVILIGSSTPFRPLVQSRPLTRLTLLLISGRRRHTYPPSCAKPTSVSHFQHHQVPRSSPKFATPVITSLANFSSIYAAKYPPTQHWSLQYRRGATPKESSLTYHSSIDSIDSATSDDRFISCTTTNSSTIATIKW